MSPPAADGDSELVCSDAADQLLDIIEHRQTDGSTVLVLVGELDIANVDRLNQRLVCLHQARTATVLDLSGLTFIDCAGVGVLMTAQARARRDRAWTLELGPQIRPQVRRLITLVAAQCRIAQRQV